MDDRRNQERVDVCLDAVWDGRSGNYTARVIDLSDGGCFVDTMGEACTGERLSFRVQLPSGVWLELTGEVAHHLRQVGFGLRFVDLSADQIEQLRSFIAYLKGPHDAVPALLR